MVKETSRVCTAPLLWNFVVKWDTRTKSCSMRIASQSAVITIKKNSDIDPRRQIIQNTKPAIHNSLETIVHPTKWKIYVFIVALCVCCCYPSVYGFWGSTGSIFLISTFHHSFSPIRLPTLQRITISHRIAQGTCEPGRLSTHVFFSRRPTPRISGQGDRTSNQQSFRRRKNEREFPFTIPSSFLWSFFSPLPLFAPQPRL